jgi:hypothetical protein
MHQSQTSPGPPIDRGTSELLILPDGRILARSLTPEVTVLLAEFAPADETLAVRCKTALAQSISQTTDAPLR